MPTPTGMLKRGDRLRNPNVPGTDFEVVERLGNDLSYGVRVRRVDGLPIEGGQDHGRMTGLVLEIAWKLDHPRNSSWRLVTGKRTVFELVLEFPAEYDAKEAQESLAKYGYDAALRVVQR